MKASPFALWWGHMCRTSLLHLGRTSPDRGTPSRRNGRKRPYSEGQNVGKRDPMPGRLSRKRLEPRPC